jgi:DNA invertase Pin-like site-specific DNA recombinase
MRKARRRTPSETPTAVGYVRVSTDEQADSRAGLEAQRAAIQTECDRRGWPLMALHEDAGISGKATTNRPALASVLEALSVGKADVLVVAKLDRLSRSLLDFAQLLHRASIEGWRMVILDLAVDTTTPSGEVMAHVAAAFAQYERRLISDRTKDALAEVRKRGVRLGRPRTLDIDIVNRIVSERSRGATLAAIADELDANGIPTAQGGRRWYPATVAAVLRSASLDAAA